MGALKQGDPVRFMDGDLPASGTVLDAHLHHMVWVRDMAGAERLLWAHGVVLDHARQFMMLAADQPRRSEES